MNQQGAAADMCFRLQPPVFWTAALKKKKKVVTCLLLVVFCETQSLCFANYTNCRSTLLIDYHDGFLLSAYATPFTSWSIVSSWSCYWHWWLLCAVACPALLDINCQVINWKLVCPFSPFSVFHRQRLCLKLTKKCMLFHSLKSSEFPRKKR